MQVKFQYGYRDIYERRVADDALNRKIFVLFMVRACKYHPC